MLEKIILALIPLFVAVDAVGVLPIYINLTYNLDLHQKRKIITGSVLTALLLSFIFLFLGKFIFKVMGITMNDFLIGGGIILFLISIRDLLTFGKRDIIPASELAVVPLGTPLMAGPAVLTTTLIMLDQYGVIPTIISVAINIIFAGIIFLSSESIIKVIGNTGTKVLSKIANLLLSAISVMMIRKGITGIIEILK